MPQPGSNKRGRPLKFGRPATAIAVTLPDDVIAQLRTIDQDLGRAIVTLVQGGARREQADAISPNVALARTGRRHGLIVVNPDVLPSLPGCSFVRTTANQAFITLEPGSGVADLEVAVIDRLSEPGLDEKQRGALGQLRDDIRRWRQDSRMRAHSRGIILLEEAS